MLRRILSIIVAIVGLVLLFLLVRTLVHTFTGSSKVTPPAKPRVSVSRPAEPKSVATAPVDKSPAAPATTPTAPVTKPATGTSTATTNGTTKLSNTGPNDIALISLGAGTGLSAMYIVRRRQLAQL